MSEPTADQTFDLFCGQWKRRDPMFHLDDEKVRDKLMTLVSAAMSVLVLAPETFGSFIDGCATVAKTVVPSEAQEIIKRGAKRT
jgi:hypothetical protein